SRQGTAGEAHLGPDAHSPSISGSGALIMLELHHCGVRRAVVREASDQAVVAKLGKHALRCYGKLGDGENRANQGPELFALDGARLEANLHSWLDALPTIRWNIDESLERRVLGSNSDH